MGGCAANAHAHAFAVPLVFLHLHAGDALQGVGDVDVRELTDVFRRDRVDDGVGLPLDADVSSQ